MSPILERRNQIVRGGAVRAELPGTVEPSGRASRSAAPDAILDDAPLTAREVVADFLELVAVIALLALVVFGFIALAMALGPGLPRNVQ